MSVTKPTNYQNLGSRILGLDVHSGIHSITELATETREWIDKPHQNIKLVKIS